MDFFVVIGILLGIISLFIGAYLWLTIRYVPPSHVLVTRKIPTYPKGDKSNRWETYDTGYHSINPLTEKSVSCNISPDSNTIDLREIPLDWKEMECTSSDGARVGIDLIGWVTIVDPVTAVRSTVNMRATLQEMVFTNIRGIVQTIPIRDLTYKQALIPCIDTMTSTRSDQFLQYGVRMRIGVQKITPHKDLMAAMERSQIQTLTVNARVEIIQQEMACASKENSLKEVRIEPETKRIQFLKSIGMSDTAIIAIIRPETKFVVALPALTNPHVLSQNEK